MNQNIDLRFELSEAAATVADTSLIVRARFVEAADTMAHDVRNIRPAVLRAFWPEHILDYKEVRTRYRPTASAISRAEEVMYGWLLQHVTDEERRVLLGKWSMCLAAPQIAGSFRNEFSSITSALLKAAQSLHEPDWSRVSPMMPSSATDLDKVETPVATSQTHWQPADAKPIHDPDSPELAKLIKRLERANRRRQKAA